MIAHLSGAPIGFGLVALLAVVSAWFAIYEQRTERKR